MSKIDANKVSRKEYIVFWEKLKSQVENERTPVNRNRNDNKKVHINKYLRNR